MIIVKCCKMSFQNQENTQKSQECSDIPSPSDGSKKTENIHWKIQALDGEIFLNIQSHTGDINLDLLKRKNHLLLNLKHVNISCGLIEIPDVILNLKYLTELNLSNNCLKILPKEIGNLCNLITLKLSRNKLNCLPKSLKHIQQLRCLDLSNNQFSKVPGVLYYGVMALQVLDLSFNKITQFNEPPACLNKLIILNISNNFLNELPHWIFDNLCQLQLLNISQNSLTLSTDHIYYCCAGVFESLQILNFENCNLNNECIKFLSLFKNLNALHIGNKKCLNENRKEKNYMGNLNMDFFKNLENMKCLHMQNVQIGTLPLDFDSLMSVEVLELSGNLLSWLPDSLCNLINLKILKVTSNQLLFLPKNIGNLVNLQQIHLANNKLNQIPKSFYNLVNLEFIDLYNNEIDKIDPCIFEEKNLKGIDLGMNCLQLDFSENYINSKVKELYTCLRDAFRNHFCFMDSRLNLQLLASDRGFDEKSSDCQSDGGRYSSSSFDSESFSEVTDSPLNFTENSHYEDENWEIQELSQSEEDEFFDPNEMNKRQHTCKYWSLDFRNNFCPAKYHTPSLMKSKFAIPSENETVEEGQFDSD